MTAQILTLVGVVIGAFTSYLATAAAERAKFKRAMAMRWDERRLETYIAYTTAVKEVVRAGGVMFEPHNTGADDSRHAAAMEEANARRSVTFETLLLLASPATIEVAHELNHEVRKAMTHVRLPEHREPDGWESIGPEAMRLLNKLHEVARQDLGVSWTS
ncbi:hypothetical protein OG394_12545 [Kribbella sp. NBC_01245]|uniref:hypothetical protein n=1 Tax=Kribbella sp. NBC_01245 TaxID=2903578 RepID=UPI002E280CBA|nr:hypothetical protein [Kribbella sp. NBC_01245]